MRIVRQNSRSNGVLILECPYEFCGCLNGLGLLAHDLDTYLIDFPGLRVIYLEEIFRNRRRSALRELQQEAAERANLDLVIPIEEIDDAVHRILSEG